MISSGEMKELMDDIISIDEAFVVVIGCFDFIEYNYTTPLSDINIDSIYRIIGRGADDSILSTLKEYEFDIYDIFPLGEGEYEFKAILRWITDHDDYHNYSYMEVEHIEFKLIQTFKERERENKLNTLFDF